MSVLKRLKDKIEELKHSYEELEKENMELRRSLIVVERLSVRRR